VVRSKPQSSTLTIAQHHRDLARSLTMPVRTRSQATRRGVGPEAITLLSLPDDLLLRCLGPLSQEER